eukprot:SAG25_NODE_243_length_11142_cov_106.401069_11_plen_81_part_00
MNELSAENNTHPLFRVIVSWEKLRARNLYQGYRSVSCSIVLVPPSLSTRMQAAERWDVLAAKERLSQRLEELLDTLYDTC